MALNSERKFHMLKLLLHYAALHGHGDINCWKQDGNSWHSGRRTGFGLKSVVKILVVQLRSCESLDKFLKNMFLFASFILFCTGSFIHSGTVLNTGV